MQKLCFSIKKPAVADLVLTKLKIFPFEGSTEAHNI